MTPNRVRPRPAGWRFEGFCGGGMPPPLGIVRALPDVTDHARSLADADPAELDAVVEGFDSEAALAAAEAAMSGQE